MEPFLWIEGMFTRIEVFDGRPLLIEMYGGDGMVMAIADMKASALKDKMGRIFGLDGSFDGFLSLAKSKGRMDLVDLVHQGHGRLLRGGSFFEDVIKTVFTINANWPFTKRMNADFCARYGCRHQGTGRYSFPSPDQVVGPIDINAGYRKATLCNVMASFADLEELYENRSYDDLHQALLEVKGIGPYAATHINIMAGDRSRIPVDTWACKVMGIENDGHARRRINNMFQDEWGEHAYTAYMLEAIVRLNSM